MTATSVPLGCGALALGMLWATYLNDKLVNGLMELFSLQEMRNVMKQNTVQDLFRANELLVASMNEDTAILLRDLPDQVDFFASSVILRLCRQLFVLVGRQICGRGLTQDVNSVEDCKSILFHPALLQQRLDARDTENKSLQRKVKKAPAPSDELELHVVGEERRNIKDQACLYCVGKNIYAV
jgi:hypothetical protein